MSLGNIPDDFRVPLVIIDIDNSQALDSAPAQSRKIIVIGQQSPTGTATALMSNRITSDSTADQLYGKGSMLAGMLKTLRKPTVIPKCGRWDWLILLPVLRQKQS